MQHSTSMQMGVTKGIPVPRAAGDPFIESNYGVHSREFEIGVLQVGSCCCLAHTLRQLEQLGGSHLGMCAARWSAAE